MVRWILGIFFWLSCAQAAVLVDQVSLAQQQLTALQQEWQQRTGKFKPVEPNEQILAQARLEVETLSVQISNLQAESNSLHSSRENLIDAIRAHTRLLMDVSGQDDVNVESVRINLEKDQENLLWVDSKLKSNRVLLETVIAIFELQKTWLAALQERFDAMQLSTQEQEQDVLENELQKERQKWRMKILELSEQLREALHNGSSNSRQLDLESQIFAAKEREQLAALRLSNARSHIQLMMLPYQWTVVLNAPNKFLDIARRYERVLTELKVNESLIKTKLSLLEKYIVLAKQRQPLSLVSPELHQKQLSVYEELARSYQEQQLMTKNLLSGAQANQKEIRRAKLSQLTAMHHLPHSALEWKKIGSQLVQLPVLFQEYLFRLRHKLILHLQHFTGFRLVLLLCAGVVWYALAHQLRQRILGYLNQPHRAQRAFGARVLKLLCWLLLRNWTALMGLTSILSFLLLTGFPYRYYSFLLFVLSPMLLFQMVLSFLRLFFFEQINQDVARDMRLYRLLRWTLLCAMWSTPVVLLARVLLPGSAATGLLERIFMLVLLALGLALFRHSKVLTDIVLQNIQATHYVPKYMHLFVFLFPLFLLGASLIGVIGYLQFALQILKLQTEFFLVALFWFFLSNLLNDEINRLAALFLRRYANGWFWSEAFIKPIQHLIHLILFVGAFLLLFELYRRDQGFLYEDFNWAISVVQVLLWVKDLKLLRVGNAFITPYKLGMCAAVLLFFMWLARWSKELSYRWLFANIRDSGLRYSLAVFVQYTIMFLGFYQVAWLSAIDSTALTVVVGAFTVGLGFGFRDVLGNLLSGILLLMERPIREGDVITVGQYEGQVTAIGLRAITLNSADNKQVVVPNAYVMTTPFVNWTLTDSVVRTELSIYVGHKGHPVDVIRLIHKTIAAHAAVLLRPVPAVIFAGFDEQSLKFNISYFTDMATGISRSGIQSEILTALWDNLRAAGFEMPVPRQRIDLYSLPTEDTAMLASAGGRVEHNPGQETV